MAMVEARSSTCCSIADAEVVRYKCCLLGDRLTVRLQSLDLRIGVRIPVSQPTSLPDQPLTGSDQSKSALETASRKSHDLSILSESLAVARGLQ